MQFAAIPGLPETKEKLLNAVKLNHLAHALLFHGPEGSANLKMALALATYTLCQQPGDSDSCGTCPSCQKMSRLVHPDMNFVFPLVGESKEDYKTRRTVINKMVKQRLKYGYNVISR
jgi:DNA polymerase-3 subunit delta'